MKIGQRNFVQVCWKNNSRCCTFIQNFSFNIERMFSSSLFTFVLCFVVVQPFHVGLFSRAFRPIVSRIKVPNSRLPAVTTTAPDVTILTAEPVLTRTDPVKLLLESEFCQVYANATVLAAIQNMNVMNKGGLLVVNENNTLAGIFTERDFIVKVQDPNRSISETIVSTVMTPVSKLFVASPSTSLTDCRQIMLSKNVRHLPIVDSNNAPVGIVSMRDIIRALQLEDLRKSSAILSGDTLDQIEEQFKDRANSLALSEEGKKQDILRSGFVFLASTILVGIVQGDWIRQHEYLAMWGTFILGYLGIIFETTFEFNKAGIALIMCTVLWTIFTSSSSLTGVDPTSAMHLLSEKVSEVSEIVFFILGAMTIVEIVDSHQGFKVVTDKIESNSKRNLMWVIGILTFFMSAILDNLTTTIVMVSLVKKLLPDIDDRKLFGALIVIAANAGGAWTPIGDVTTTMLWINGQISAIPTMTNLFFPSLVSVIVSLFALQRFIPAEAPVPPKKNVDKQLAPRGQLVFTTGILGLVSVPIFKSITGLPPYLGMLAALGVIWSLTDAIHAGEGRESLMAPAALKKIDTSGVLFFLGILLSIGALDSAGVLRNLAEFLDQNVPSESIVAMLIGLASAVIDNVPLVAATMGMYDLSKVAPDSSLWQLIAYCAGTGGSLLVIGSAAGVALMGLEKVDFLWYAKKITLPAAAGYFAGIGAYLAQEALLHQTNLLNSLPQISSILP